MGEIKVLNSKLAYDGFLKVYEDEILLENGVVHTFSLIKQKKAASVLPITKEGKIILVRQFRPGIKQYTLEIPAGLLDENETHFECVKRELLEETGYDTEDIEFFCKYSSIAGVSDEIVEIFIAKDIKKVSDLKLDETEVIEVKEYDLEDAVKMIDNGLIIDSKTVISILKYKLSLK